MHLTHQVEFVIEDSRYSGLPNLGLEFTLSYRGSLLGSGNKNPRAKHKHELRKHFHPQLRNFYQGTVHLRDKKWPWPDPVTAASQGPGAVGPSWLDGGANKFSKFGYRFFPLVLAGIDLLCSVDILWMRPDAPGFLIQSGDIDNRLKTLFDAFRKPNSAEELRAYPHPTLDEDPFYCLLEDDKLISALKLKTAPLLEPFPRGVTANDAQLVFAVKIQPYHQNWVNADFA